MEWRCARRNESGEGGVTIKAEMEALSLGAAEEEPTPQAGAPAPPKGVETGDPVSSRALPPSHSSTSSSCARRWRGQSEGREQDLATRDMR